MENSDLFSDVFSTLRLKGHLYFRARLSGPFAVEVPVEGQRIRFHYLRRGRVTVSVGETWQDLTEGDMIIVPGGCAHILADEVDRNPIPLSTVMDSGALTDGVLMLDNGPDRAELLCGFCTYDEALTHPLIAQLPDVILLRPTDLGQEPWLLAALNLLRLEVDLGGEGMAAILTRLLEILLIQSIRSQTPKDAPGFATALADPGLSRALATIHQAPEVGWTLSMLAREAAMSRASFARHFTETMGMPPMTYVTNWRLALARRMLTDSTLSIDEIAQRTGYGSRAAFTRRYAATFGQGPSADRRASRLI